MSNPPSLQRLRAPRLRLPAEEPVMGEVDRLGLDSERAAVGGFQRRPAVASVTDYPGRWGPRRTGLPCHGWG
jgi:hypothetical protein